MADAGGRRLDPLTAPFDPAPLIVTADLGPRARAYFDRLRRELFPPDRLQIGAHLTLFHALPPSSADEAARACAAEAAQAGGIAGRAASLYSLGRGIAFRIDAPALVALRARLADRFAGLLTAQDEAPFRAHVTVMNKADPKAARAALEQLRATFTPFDVPITGLALWRYRGGPWEPVRSWRLRGRP